MNNQRAWDEEYKESQLLSKNDEPQADVLRFIKWLRKDAFYDTDNRVVLDLGCGNGRNVLYFANQYDCSGYGYDFSSEAIRLAENNLHETKPKNSVIFEERNIGKVLPLADNSVDIILDVTSSNSLSPDERNIYLAEAARVLKPEGYMFVRTLTRDGDRNAQNLLQMFPSEYYDTYTHPDLGVTERVFREEDFRELYGLYFDIQFLKKQTGYQRWGAQSYKRRYLVAYLQTKGDSTK